MIPTPAGNGAVARAISVGVGIICRYKGKMPELPEVETTLRGLAPKIEQNQLVKLTLRVPKLRWDIPADIANTLENQRVIRAWRRGKYLLWDFAHGDTQLLHLGMSGRINCTQYTQDIDKYEHIQWDFADGTSIRLRDPRKFGALLYTKTPLLDTHPLLAKLGPEPLEKSGKNGFHVDDFAAQLARRRAPIKAVIMDASVVVGVGNIYANEALFRAKIHPATPANFLKNTQIKQLHKEIQAVLTAAILAGGTTLRDYRQSDGNLGYFHQQFQVYGRLGEACYSCKSLIKKAKIGQRGTYYCPKCQGTEPVAAIAKAVA